ncbi:MAG TPA: transcription termination factor Rho [Acidimicrobiales bacterium]
MTAEQQLERSVLEGKERDELNAIAQAMSLKTTTRTKKADIIDRILEATGVTAAGPSDAAGPRAAAPAPVRPDGPGGTGQGEPRPAGDRSNGTSGPSAAAETNGAAPPASADPAEERATSVTSNGHGTPVVTNGSEAGSPEGSSNGAVGLATSAPAAQASTADGRSTPPAGQAGQTGPGQTGQNGSAHRQPTRHQGNPGNQGNQGNQNGAGGAQGLLDAGNRRGRRRRGRERVPGTERELQGGTNQDAPYQGDLVEVRGLLDLRDEGYGFLRCDGYLPSGKDVYVSISQARRFALRKGDYVEGACRPASNNEKYPALLRIDSVSGLDPDAALRRPRFEDLTPLFPDSKLNLEMQGDKDNVTARIVDLLSPIGKGQRGLIVSPPKAGKTTIMKQIAHSIEANNPDVHLMVLLVDERPEEVTDMRRSVRGEVVASTFDRPSDEHTAVAELAIERAKRLVEMGKDVVIILDGITRLARAYNLAAPATGRIMSGGVDSGALYPPKKFFGAARNIEEGGSLTILATALVETGSKMDEVIFEEFKGTGNMELRLDRRLAERRLYPSIDVNASSTRHEELLFDRGQLQQVWKLRRVLNALASDGNAASGLELLMDKVRTTKSNDEFLAEIAKGPTLN